MDQDFLKMTADFNKKMNRNYVLEQIKVYDLASILMQNRVEMLMQKASAIGIAGRSKMNKSALVAALTEVIPERETLWETMKIVTEDQYRFFMQPAEQSESVISNELPFKYRYLINRGILAAIQHGEQYEYVVPMEVKAALKQLDWKQLSAARTYEHKLMEYIEAAVHLYGVCTPQRISDIYSSHHEDTVDIMEWLRVADGHDGNRQSYYFNGRYFVNSYFEDRNRNELDELLLKVKDKPYYIPEQEQFLKYSNSSYFEVTPQLLRLKRFLIQDFQQSEQRAELLMEEVQIMCAMEYDMQQLMNELSRLGISIQSFDQAQKLVSVIVDVYNTTRLWSNCGHTPEEIRKVTGEGERPRDASLQHFNPVKIGRNEPCICGSGKKYKKCCG